MSKIILASASPRRKEIMELMGLNFIVCPSQCEENITETVPARIVMELSKQKAEDVARTAEDGDIIIGADTIVVLGNRILGKPHDRGQAFEMIRSLAGGIHHVFTGVTIIKGNQRETFNECTEVHVACMSDAEINEYLDKGEYGDKAGAYGIQGSFAPFITGINGDYYNVVGLPAAALYKKLKQVTDVKEKI